MEGHTEKCMYDNEGSFVEEEMTTLQWDRESSQAPAHGKTEDNKQNPYEASQKIK